jgi:mono/diheme cytochrome c family protein
MRRLLVFTLLTFSSLAAVAAGRHEHKSDDRGVWVEIAQAPASTRSWKNPYEGQADGVAAGDKLFHQHCADCHGDDARGKRAPNLRSAGVQNATPGELAWLLRNGNMTHRMPPWAGIPEQRRWQIVAYIKSLGVETKSSASNATPAAANLESR